MQSSDKQAFLKTLVTLSELFGKPMSAAIQVMYFDALQDIDATVLARAMNAAARGCQFMPKPSELRTLAVGDDETHTELAWMGFKQALGRVGAYKSLVTHDPALGETITAMFGSWPSACSSDFSQEMWASKRKEFGRIYRVMRGRALDGSRYLPGIVERENAGRADWAKYTEIGTVGQDGTVRLLTAAEAEQERTVLAVQAGAPTPVSRLLHLVEPKPEERDSTA